MHFYVRLPGVLPLRYVLRSIRTVLSDSLPVPLHRIVWAERGGIRTGATGTVKAGGYQFRAWLHMDTSEILSGFYV